MFLSYKNIALLVCLIISFVLALLITKIYKQPIQDRNINVYTYEPSILNPDPKFFTPTPSPESKSRPSITAKAYLVGDLSNDKILLEKNSYKVLPVASMSKLVTAFVATNELNLDKKIEITKSALDVPPDGSNLKLGEVFTVKELLYPMLLSSSNVSAEAIASSSNRARFMEQMRSYAWEIGMSSSYFEDPTGLDSANNATARDLFLLAKYLYQYRSDILSLTKVSSVSFASTTEHGQHDIKNIHPFVNDDRFIGGKTGRTDAAGDTMMTILSINNKPIVFIVLGSAYDNRASDTRLLLKKIQDMQL